MITLEATTIIDALNKKVAEIFDATTVPQIYVDTVPQDFKRPSIAILELTMDGDDGLKNDDYEIQDKYTMFDIVYFPSSKDKIYSEFRKIRYIIDTYLTEIGLGDNYLLDRLNMPKHNVTENIGHSIITFFYRVAAVNTNKTDIIRRINTDETHIGG